MHTARPGRCVAAGAASPQARGGSSDTPVVLSLPTLQQPCQPVLPLARAPSLPCALLPCRPAQVNIYTINDLLSRKGWHLNALQHPAALHICFTAAHSEALADALLAVSGGVGPGKGKGQGRFASLAVAGSDF